MRPVVNEINIYSDQGRLLKVRIEESNGGFIISGDYGEDDKSVLNAVGFSGNIIANCEERFDNIMEKFRVYLKSTGDQIIRLHNPCNTPFITAPQQAAIVQRLVTNG